jgi:hypothetical protein
VEDPDVMREEQAQAGPAVASPAPARPS